MKRGNEKLSKLAEKCTSADHLSEYNRELIEAIINKLKSLFLKATNNKTIDDEDQFHTYNRVWLEDDIHCTTKS